MLLAVACAAAAASVGPSWGPSWAFLDWASSEKKATAANEPPPAAAVPKAAETGEEELEPLLPTSRSQVMFADSLPTDGSCEPELAPFSDSAGRPHSCCLLRREARSMQDEAYAKTILQSTDIPGVDALLATQVGYVWNTNGWWAYEICLGHYIWQYHEENGAIGANQFLGAAKDILTKNAPLRCSFTKRMAKGSAHKSVRAKILALYEKQKVTSDGKWKIRIHPRTKRVYLSSQYGSGEACEATGEPRTTEVRLYCPATEDQDAGFNVTEVHTCEYVANIFMGSVCSFKPYASVAALVAKEHDVLSPADKRKVAAAKRKAVLDSKNVAAVNDAIRQELGLHGCTVLKTNSWWNYELCVHYWLRQYHEEDDVVTEEYFIGRGKNANSDDLLTKRKLRVRMGESATRLETMKTRASLPTPIQANGTWQASNETGSYFFKTLMTDGQICDMTGKPRETELHVYCGRDPSKMFSVQETSTCRYEARLMLSSICRLKEYNDLVQGDVSVRQARVASVLCAPNSEKDETQEVDEVKRPSRPSIILA
ncbi:Protein OS-9-like protein [Diplonema papillatum]|nr:Protein OS-9-like protein [Diplonema papillatum]